MMPKKYCLELTLRDDEELISEYARHHEPGNVWPEVIDSIRSAGILSMRIFRTGTQLFMVLETDDSFSFERKAEADKKNPSVKRWESLMEQYQQVAGVGSEKWTPADLVFDLDEH